MSDKDIYNETNPLPALQPCAMGETVRPLQAAHCPGSRFGCGDGGHSASPTDASRSCGRRSQGPPKAVAVVSGCARPGRRRWTDRATEQVRPRHQADDCGDGGEDRRPFAPIADAEKALASVALTDEHGPHE